VQVDDAIDTFVIVLQSNIILERTQIVAQMSTSGGTDTGKDTTFFNHNFLEMLFFPGKLLDQTKDFSWLRVASGLEFGVD
jgi:hypothetical protein